MKKPNVNETTLSYFKKTFEMDAPAPLLTTNISRQVGNYVGVDFNKIAPADYHEGLKVEKTNDKNSPSDENMKMGDWAKYGKIAWTHLQKDPLFYHTNETLQATERLKEFIRREILGILEAKASHNVKVYLKPGEKAPKGVKLNKGARGGSYYWTKSGNVQGGKHMGYPKKPDKAQLAASQKSQEKKAAAQIKQDTGMIKTWIEKNRHKLPIHKIDWNKVKQNYPGLTDDQQQEYGEMLLYPFHSAFSMYDLKDKYRKLSNAQLKTQNPKKLDIMNTRKKLANVFNTQGFRYYGPGDGSTNASIVAPSKDKKWYGKIRDILDKEGLEDYRLDAAQKPGYYILRFE